MLFYFAYSFRCKNGNVLVFENSAVENRPQMIHERNTFYDFSASKLIQIFESNLICVIFDGGESHLTVVQILGLQFVIFLFLDILN